jgi:hypothetical protein
MANLCVEVLGRFMQQLCVVSGSKFEHSGSTSHPAVRMGDVELRLPVATVMVHVALVGGWKPLLAQHIARFSRATWDICGVYHSAFSDRP